MHEQVKHALFVKWHHLSHMFAATVVSAALAVALTSPLDRRHIMLHFLLSANHECRLPLVDVGTSSSHHLVMHRACAGGLR